MNSALSILADISLALSGVILHGKPVKTELISDEKLHAFSFSNSLRKASFSVTVFGKDQKDVLDKLDACRKKIAALKNVFPPDFHGASGKWLGSSEYSYTLKFDCIYLSGGDSLI